MTAPFNNSEIAANKAKSFYPLSYGQQALWFLYQMAPESVAYNIFITVRIRSTLDIPNLCRAWEKIVDSHPILRTTYTTYEGKPVQLLHEQQEVNIQVTDASNWSEDYLREQIFAETDRPFNLEQDSVLRVNLFTQSAQEHILLLTIHHIASDSWSVDLLLNELQVLYDSETQKVSQEQTEVASDSLPKNKPYTEFVPWQSEMLSGSRGEKLWEYWQKQLAGELPILNLPTDQPRPPVQTYRGDSHIFKLDEQLIQELRNVALVFGTSLYKILLAAFYVQLYHYTNQEDILIGSPMLGRWGREFKATVGYFVNPVVLRTSVSGSATFKEFLAQVSNTVKEAQKHQDYPFSLLVERLQPERDLSRSPLYQVSFTWQKQRWYKPGKNSLKRQERGLQMEPYLLGHQRGTDFDLDVMVMEVQGLLQVCWQYNTDLFNAATISRMTRHFQTLLEGIVANPEQLLSELPLLTEAERHQLTLEWNNTQTDYPNNKCIHQLFEEQVQRTPDAIAVEDGSQQLTYNQLNRCANQIAHYLQTLGVGPEVLVGICIDRSPLMVVGLLAILKAGGAYVPLDPAYPAERLAYMLSDSQVKVLLTQEKLADTLPQNQAKLICLDRDWPASGTTSQEHLLTGVKPNNLAYVIYTSGSTGQPKGVMICHQSVVNYIAAKKVAYGMNSNDRVLQFSSISFDYAVCEIYNCLICGGTLVLRTDEMLSSVSTFLQKCREWQLTVLGPPTFYWHLLTTELATTQKSLPESVRLMCVGGEQVLPEKLMLWQKYVNDSKHRHQMGKPPLLINEYGPTEATVDATICNLSELVLEDTHSIVPIGRPIANVQVYILDQYLQIVPIGVPGELYIGGAGLARGYLNRPDLTAEKFIPNPFSNESEARLYKTGDLVRYRPDGNIEFIGRIDHQVKIRGFRIELGEIETAIGQHSEVRECVVIVRTKESGDKQLVAYVVPKLSTLTASKLRSFLQQKLPNYMVPAAFVVLESLPLTPNGKVDRRALPAPDKSSFTDTGFVPPRDALERQLAQIWSEILDVESVGVKDNFFALGGHSLLAVRLMAKIQQEFGKSLPLATLFQSPTIADLANLIKTEKNVPTNFCLVPIQPKGNKSPFFCIHAVGGDVLCYADLAGHLGLEQPFYALRSLGLDGSCEPLTRIEDMAATYIKALQTIQPEGPYQLGGWSIGGAIAFEMAVQLKASGHTVSLLALIDSYAPIQKFKDSLLMDDTILLADWVKNLSGLSNKALSISAEILRLLEAQEQLNYVLKQAKEVGLLPKEMGQKQGSSLFRVFKANSQAIARYTPQPYLGRITFFYADESMKQNQDPSLGWASVAAGSITTHNISGNHYSIIESKILAQKLRTYLPTMAKRLIN